jgi:hypothetical protein
MAWIISSLLRNFERSAFSLRRRTKFLKILSKKLASIESATKQSKKEKSAGSILSETTRSMRNGSEILSEVFFKVWYL